MILAASNPFIRSYVESDWFGKGIFLGLFALSALCWLVILYKAWQFWVVRRISTDFSDQFEEKKEDPLNRQFQRPILSRIGEVPHPLFDIYRSVKQQSLQLLSRNTESNLTSADIQLIESGVCIAMGSAFKKLDRFLYLLPMIATLAPFFGLLGTVWGILLTFSSSQGGLAASNTAMLSALSMALTTTVLGLVIAIPAVVGYSYLKNVGKDIRYDMEAFSHELLASIEMLYRRD